MEEHWQTEESSSYTEISSFKLDLILEAWLKGGICTFFNNWVFSPTFCPQFIAHGSYIVELLSDALGFLRNPQVYLRRASVILIGKYNSVLIAWLVLRGTARSLPLKKKVNRFCWWQTAPIHGGIYDEQRSQCVIRMKFYFILRSEYSCVIKLLYRVYLTRMVSKSNKMACHCSLFSFAA